MKCDYYFTDNFGGISKGCYTSNNLATHVGDDEKNVFTNRQNLAKKLNLKHTQFMNQVHGDEIALITKPINPPTCDGLMTNIPNIALFVLVADCTPLLLHDSKNSAIAALHVGRKGAFLDITTRAIFQMKNSFNTSPQDIKAYIGAGIGQCCYEINGKALEEAQRRFKSHLSNNFLSIGGIIKEQLKKIGVENIQESSECTKCNDRHFSYRRDGITGREAGIIILRS